MGRVHVAIDHPFAGTKGIQSPCLVASAHEPHVGVRLSQVLISSQTVDAGSCQFLRIDELVDQDSYSVGPDVHVGVRPRRPSSPPMAFDETWVGGAQVFRRN